MKQEELFLSQNRKVSVFMMKKKKAIFSTVYSLRNQKNDFDKSAEAKGMEKVKK
jgi:hypothetical protein